MLQQSWEEECQILLFSEDFFEVYKLGSYSLATPNLEERAQVFTVSSRVPKIRASTSQE